MNEKLDNRRAQVSLKDWLLFLTDHQLCVCKLRLEDNFDINHKSGGYQDVVDLI